MLLDYGVDSSIQTNYGDTALLAAVFGSNHDMMRSLLDWSTVEVDLANELEEAHSSRHYRGREKSVALLLAAGTSVSDQMPRALLHGNGRISLMKPQRTKEEMSSSVRECVRGQSQPISIYRPSFHEPAVFAI